VAQFEFNKEAAEQLERIYASRDVLRRRRLVREALGAQRGERVLDVGCGPGFYVAELLEEVGPEGSAVGLDASPDMLAVTRRRTEGHDNVELQEADATSLPVKDADFDRALSVQVMEYVADIPAALGEIRRALRPGGRVVIWDVDWATLSMHSSDPERLDRVLDAWDQHLTHPSLPRVLTTELRAAGFEDVQMEGHVFATNELVPDAYGGAFVPIIQGYVQQAGITEDEATAWADEQRELNERGEFYFAVVQFCFTATKPASG
jgi:ubiquinone/menaquinone biosynthesis C-methylase UbiE